jgi:adenylate cyclase
MTQNLTNLWMRLHRAAWHGRGIWITVPIVVGTLFSARAIGFLQPLELSLYDTQLRLRPPQSQDDRIVIVGITESDLQKVGEWPFPDRILAQVLTNIKKQKPSVIGLDVYRDLPVPPSDRAGVTALNYLFKSTPNLVGIEKRSIDRSIPSVKPPPLLDRMYQVGVNNFPIDIDSRVRRSLLYFDEGESRYPSFALQVALTHLENQKILPTADGQEMLTINGHSFKPFESNHGGYVNVDNLGYQLLINYQGGSKNFKEVSFRDVLQGKIPGDLFRDRIVLIGSVASSLNDEFLTPYSSNNFLQTPEKMPGVKLHGNIVSHLLRSTLEKRPEIQSWNKLSEALWIAGWTTLAAILYWHFRNVQRFSWRREVGLAAIIGLSSGISQVALTIGWWLPLAPTLLGIAGGVMGIVAYGAWSAAELRKTFGRYLTAEVVTQLLETPKGLHMGGDRRTVTMLMADLRGFSSASERQAPEQVITFLNQYLEIMTDVITRHQGTIDEFLGDGILVLFGAPTERSDDADRAVACAIDMQLELVKVNQYAHLMGVAEVEMGVGIHTGEVIVGNIGSLKRAKYGIVGSHMNLTARIESYTVGGQILMSQATHDALKLDAQVKGVMRVEAKGIQNALTLYEVNGFEGRMLPDRPNPLEELIIPIPVQFAVIEGKHVQIDRAHGLLRKISPRGAVFQSPIELPVYTNVKLNLNQHDRTADFYAKIMRVINRPISEVNTSDQTLLGNSSGWIYYIHFTFITPEVFESFQAAVVGSGDRRRIPTELEE